MNKRWTATLVLFAAFGGLAAAGGTATDQAVSLTYSASHWGTGPGADLTGVDATGDAVYQLGIWYRAEGDTEEHPLPAPDTESYTGGAVDAVWNNLDGKGFAVEERTTVIDGEGPSGCFLTYVSVRNDNSTDKHFTTFQYLDPDLASSATGDSATSVGPRFVEFTDGASRLAYRAGAGTSHYQVAAYPALRNLLNDTSVTDLNDTGLPFGPGDVTVAYQFGPQLIPAGSSSILGMAAGCFNAPRRHVKGDFYGLGVASLYGQVSDLSNRMFAWMRRTQQLGGGFFFGAPTATSSLVGVDDFVGDNQDETVWRDTVTGAAYVDFHPVTGAPTLALNWKLSATGDFSGDGKADILWRNTTSQKLVVWTMNGSAKIGNIIPAPDQAVDANWEVAGATDFNGDGNRDLLWYNQTTGKIVLWFMNASVQRITGQFTNPASVGNNNWKVLAVGDYGKGAGGVYDTQDVVWQNDTSKKIVVWFMDLAGNRTNGTFTTPDVLVGAWDLVGPR